MNHSFTITLPVDENGFSGRECPSCKKYFKVKPGTGLPIEQCICPYCEFLADSSDFTTSDQQEYIHSLAEKIAYERLVAPMLNDFTKKLKELERSSRKSWLKIKVTQTGSDPYFPIKYYREQDLETEVECDNCGLYFAVFGVFASCPDCSKINAFTTFRKSLEVSAKKLNLIESFEGVTKDILESEFKNILSDVISSFDGLGKELRNRYSNIFPAKPKNLFQNLAELDLVFEKQTGQKLSDQIIDYPFLFEMFQVRHIYVHNMGVVDNDFTRKVPGTSHLLGRKYPLKRDNVIKFLKAIESLTKIIESTIK